MRRRRIGELKGSSAVRESLDQLLDHEAVLMPAPVGVELLSGAGPHSVALLNRTLGALEQLMQQWAGDAAKKGLRFGLCDLLIAACAAKRGAKLRSLDNDFEPMRRLRWVTFFEP
ncbi:MAG: hypothetical protein ACO1OB_21310 [Archangium sp.]